MSLSECDHPTYQLVQLPNGAQSVRSLEFGETMHPGLGPANEAKALYVEQLRLPERMRLASDEFVVWDVGLGAAANVLTLLKASREITSTVSIISFDITIEPLRFAAQHAEQLEYFHGYESAVESLIEKRRADFQNGQPRVLWESVLGDFPSQLRQGLFQHLPKPHAILFDPFSPAKNPAMWTQSLFADLFNALDPQRPCALATYSRSTMLRVALLLAGFFVGSGLAVGRKEETTVAANQRHLIEAPLDQRWLRRAHESASAEPLEEPRYRQAALSAQTSEKLRCHPQFNG